MISIRLNLITSVDIISGAVDKDSIFRTICFDLLKRESAKSLRKTKLPIAILCNLNVDTALTGLANTLIYKIKPETPSNANADVKEPETENKKDLVESHARSMSSFRNLDVAIKALNRDHKDGKIAKMVWVVGSGPGAELNEIKLGASMYSQVILSPLIHRLYILYTFDQGTILKYDGFTPYMVNSHKSLPQIDKVRQDAKFVRELFRFENSISAHLKEVMFMHIYEITHEEDQYLDIMRKLLALPTKFTNASELTRDIPLTRSSFVNCMRFELSSYRGGELHKIALFLTTKQLFYRSMILELLWFIKGSTSSKDLETKGVNIWKANSTREYLDKRGLDYPTGELGPLYGWSLRKFGANYPDSLGKSVDQLQNLIDGIIKNPYSRRHVISMWDPTQLSKMALPPCHILQIYRVDPDEDCVTPKWLSCHMTMRSADMFLGVPFNISSYGFLVHMISEITGLYAKELVITMSDTHIYEAHIDAVKEQLLRKPKSFPTFEFSERILEMKKNAKLTINDFTFEDFIIKNYQPDCKINAELIV